MGRLKTYALRYWRRYLVGALCLLITATLVMWIPWWIREAVRIIEHGGPLRDVTFYAVVIAVDSTLDVKDQTEVHIARVAINGAPRRDWVVVCSFFAFGLLLSIGWKLRNRRRA